jgi:hypothetical protein
MAGAPTETQRSQLMPKVRSRGIRAERDGQNGGHSFIICHLVKTRIGIVNEAK